MQNDMLTEHTGMQAAKKAKDFEVRKLKRRLRLIEVAENMPVTDTEDKLDVKAGWPGVQHRKTDVMSGKSPKKGCTKVCVCVHMEGGGGD
jgi:hypothetical protein